MHSHHTVPQCCGGKDSPQIILCPTCHNNLHASALHILTCLRNSKATTKFFWRSESEAKRAEPYEAIIVRAFQAKDQGLVEGNATIHFEATSDVYRMLKLIQQDKSSLRSLNSALAYCVRYVFEREGLSNVKKSEQPWWASGKGTRKRR